MCVSQTPSICPPTHLSIHPSVRQSSHLSIHPLYFAIVTNIVVDLGVQVSPSGSGFISLECQLEARFLSCVVVLFLSCPWNHHTVFCNKHTSFNSCQDYVQGFLFFYLWQHLHSCLFDDGHSNRCEGPFQVSSFGSFLDLFI